MVAKKTAQFKKAAALWKVGSRRYDFEWDGELIARWELEGDPISDDYTPEDISARDLFFHWVDRYAKNFPNGLVPIHWSVESPGNAKFERMPFQFDHNPDYPHEDFLTFYDWPVNAKTGEPLNWLTLPVADKGWNSKRANKGGFIQEATLWKPSILQPFVYLPSLLETVRRTDE